MPSFKERVPQERETLIFPDQEKAQEFTERVAERAQENQIPGVNRDREIIASEVAEEMAAQGHPVSTIKEPWNHTPQEHDEVQQLVNVAFAQDLGVALKQIHRHENYARLLDLFHDVITKDMYEALQQRGLNKQPVTHWVLLSVGVLAAAVLVILVLLLL